LKDAGVARPKNNILLFSFGPIKFRINPIMTWYGLY